MEKLLEIIEKAEKSKSQEVFVVAGGEPRMHTLSGWIPIFEQKIQAQEWGLLTQSVVLDKMTGLFSAGLFRKGLGDWSYRFNANPQYLWMKRMGRPIPEASDLNLPQVILEMASRSRGLVLISGPRFSGKTTTLAAVMRKIKCEKYSLIEYISPTQEFEIPGERGIVVHQEDFESVLGAYPDVVVYDCEWTSNAFDKIKNYLSRGSLVFLALPGLSCHLAIDAFLACAPDRNSAISLLQNNLITAINQRVIIGSGLDRVSATEILVATPQVKSLLEQNQWTQITEIMKTTGDKTGMRTLNQSLLQLLIRRKVEIKIAFETSVDPEELDHLLSKVGI